MSVGRRRPREEDEEEESNSEAAWLMEQLCLRVGGMGNALQALRDGRATQDINEILQKTLLNTLRDCNLLAMLLSPLWLQAADLSLVCKRFNRVIKNNPVFWMPGVRAGLTARNPKLSAKLLHLVNPFYRFPAHIWLCPDWPWWTFLAWLWDDSYLCCIEEYTHVTLKGHGPNRLKLRFWADGEVGFIRGEKILYEHELHVGYNRYRNTEQFCYTVYLRGTLVFLDGQLSDGNHWCGAMRRRIAHADQESVPVEGFGFYREKNE